MIDQRLEQFVEQFPAEKREIAAVLLAKVSALIDRAEDDEVGQAETLDYQPAWMVVLYLVCLLLGEIDAPFWGELVLTIKDGRVTTLRCPRTMKLWAMFGDLSPPEIVDGKESSGES